MFRRMRLHKSRCEALWSDPEGRREASSAVRAAVERAAGSDPAAAAVSDGAACFDPAHVAFTGVRQFELVFASDRLRLPALRRMIRRKDSDGKQRIANPVSEHIPFHMFPDDWPFGRATKVWVLTSSSGRAAAFAGRARAEHSELAQAVLAEPWPPAGLA